MAKWIVRLALGAVALLGMGWGSLTLSNSRSFQVVGDLMTSVETTDSLIALTFDDGPSGTLTDSVLALLAEHDARATFFVVGERMEQHPEVVARLLEQGHELGNHSFNHPRMVFKSSSSIRRQVELTDSLIRAAGQQGQPWFRPPYGKRLIGLPLYLSRQGRPVVLWDLEPDTYHSTADEVVDYVVENARPGSILLLHVEFPARSENRIALERLLPEMTARGYRFVTLSELVRRSDR